MVEEKASPRYMRVTWVNVLLAASVLLPAAVAIPAAVGIAQPITSPVPRLAIVAGGIVVAVGLGLVGVRAGRLGVYARADGLQIRDIFRTRIVPWMTIIGTSTQRRSNMKGATYYLPTLVVRLPKRINQHALFVLPPDQRPTVYRNIGLVWLAAAFEKTAQRRAGQIESMISSRIGHPDAPMANSDLPSR